MPLINLIQEQRLAKKRAEQKARGFFFMFAGVAVASAAGFGFFLFEKESLEREESDLQAQMQKNAPIVKQIEENQKLLSELSPRLKTLEDASIASGRWSRILDHLTVNTPQSTWLTTVRAQSTDPTKPINVSFVGVSSAQETIGEYIMRLQNLTDLENVQLKYTQEKVIQSTKAIEFEVSADVTGTAETKAKEEEAS